MQAQAAVSAAGADEKAKAEAMIAVEVTPENRIKCVIYCMTLFSPQVSEALVAAAQ